MHHRARKKETDILNENNKKKMDNSDQNLKNFKMFFCCKKAVFGGLFVYHILDKIKRKFQNEGLPHRGSIMDSFSSSSLVFVTGDIRMVEKLHPCGTYVKFR